MSKEQRFASVWDAIEDTPQQAASMHARSTLMMELENPKRAAARWFGQRWPFLVDLHRAVQG